jgi:hypothetical protein
MLALASPTVGQLNIEVKIEGAAGTTVNTQTLSSNLVSSGISTGFNTITTNQDSVLLVLKCPTGTYSKDGQACRAPSAP